MHAVVVCVVFTHPKKRISLMQVVEQNYNEYYCDRRGNCPFSVYLILFLPSSQPVNLRYLRYNGSECRDSCLCQCHALFLPSFCSLFCSFSLLDLSNLFFIHNYCSLSYSYLSQHNAFSCRLLPGLCLWTVLTCACMQKHRHRCTFRAEKKQCLQKLRTKFLH